MNTTNYMPLTPLTGAAHRQPAQQQQRGRQSHLSGCSWSEKGIDEERVGHRCAGFKVSRKKGLGRKWAEFELLSDSIEKKAKEITTVN